MYLDRFFIHLIDGVIYCPEPYNQNFLIQCKQYSNPVGVTELDDFILEMSPDWEMMVDYTFDQYKQPNMKEWVIIERVFDSYQEDN